MNPDLLKNVTVLARQMDVLCAQMRAEVSTLEAQLVTALNRISVRATELGIDPATLWAPKPAAATNQQQVNTPKNG